VTCKTLLSSPTRPFYASPERRHFALLFGA
jgi:hypothetical protein